MNKKDLGFSINFHDSDGDVYEKCVLIHYGDDLIIKFENVDEMLYFSNRLRDMEREIRDNL